MPERTWTIESLKIAVTKSKNITEVIEKLGLRAAGGNFSTIKKYIKQYNINTDHFVDFRIETLKKNSRIKQIPLENLLVKNCKYKSSVLKRRLVAAGLLKDECYICGLKTKWCGKPIVLQLDHINGVHSDCRLKNLRVLCPNCHSQAENFAGKSSKKKKDSDKNGFKLCPICKEKWIHKNSAKCILCYNSSKRKVKWPSKHELKSLLDDNTWVNVGRMFGVSHSAVRKWAKQYDLM